MAFSPGIGNILKPLGWSSSVKGGDTLTNPTAETQFASKSTIKANTLGVGDFLWVKFFGQYMIPGAVAPTTTAKILLGTAVMANSGVLSVGVGTGTVYAFWGEMMGVVTAVGTSAAINCNAWMFFQTQQAPTPTANGEGAVSGSVTFNSTIDNLLALSVTSSNVTGQYFTLLPPSPTIFQFPALATNS